MIHNAWATVAILAGIEIFVLWFSSLPRFLGWFKIFPALFWIYFLPMLFSTFGILDPKNAVYGSVTNWLLPASLFLLLSSVDIKAIFRLGRPALIMFFAGSAAFVFSAPLVFCLVKGMVGSQFWAGFGALCGSWTGGSANMIAVKESLGASDAVFLPMVVVDTVVPYAWMAILVIFVGSQPIFDRWNRSDRRILDQLTRKSKTAVPMEDTKWSLNVGMVVVILALAFGASVLSQGVAKFLPTIKDVISGFAWTIIVVSLLGILASFTPVKELEAKGSVKIGYWLLYLVLTSIGAKANLSNMGSTVILIGAGVVMVMIHAAVMIAVARWIRAPMFLVAAASQANIGGVASASIVAELYQPGLASVGLLLAILGNIIGTYLGILAGQLCRLLV
ncbi:MAG: DUF819 family protein [Candidatus Omnitrophica bacterium]|nr:DUF819 family protein [Candidatus Omnitrophota bacterium]